jgi:transcriptional regulator with XRE-family HTH domain
MSQLLKDLRKVRLSKGLSIEELAEKSGVNPYYIESLEAGMEVASDVTIARLGGVLDAGWEDLTGEDVWDYRVISSTSDSEDTRILREINQKLDQIVKLMTPEIRGLSGSTEPVKSWKDGEWS